MSRRIDLQHIVYYRKGMFGAKPESHVGRPGEIRIDVCKRLDGTEIIRKVTGKPAQYLGVDGKALIAEKVFGSRDLCAEMIGSIAVTIFYRSGV